MELDEPNTEVMWISTDNEEVGIARLPGALQKT
jgi:hypothetical protein